MKVWGQKAKRTTGEWFIPLDLSWRRRTTPQSPVVTSSPRGECRRETEGAGALFALDARRPEGSLPPTLKTNL